MILDEPKYTQMSWNEHIWGQMSLNKPKPPQLSWNELKFNKISTSYMRCVTNFEAA